jgi:hypothetical protein
MSFPTYRRVRLIKNVKQLVRRELKIDPRFAVVKHVSCNELMRSLDQAVMRINDEAKKEGVDADITITNGLSLKINGEYGTWDLYGFPKNTTVYIINSHDPTEIYKADK